MYVPGMGMPRQPGQPSPSPEQFAGLERSENPVWGARSFEVTDEGVLTGVVYKQAWLPGENLAECFKFGHITTGQLATPVSRPAHPIDDCTHGFYGYYDGSNDYHRDSRVSGVIKGYGETRLGTRGFRTMKAQIVALTIEKDVSHQLLTRIQNRYRGIHFFPSFEVMVLVFPPDKGKTRPEKEEQ